MISTGSETGQAGMVTAEIMANRRVKVRQEPREAIDAPGSLAPLTGGRSLVRVADISRRGARLETYVPLKRGSEVTLCIPGAPPLDGRVAWATDFAAGLALHKRLDEATVATLVDTYGFGSRDAPAIVSKS